MTDARVYDADQVDRYIAELQEHVASLQNEIAALHDEVALSAVANRDEAAERALGRAMIQAQLAADRAADDATREAERILENAYRRSGEILEEAKQQYDRMLDAARREADRLATDATRRQERTPGPSARPIRSFDESQYAPSAASQPVDVLRQGPRPPWVQPPRTVSPQGEDRPPNYDDPRGASAGRLSVAFPPPGQEPPGGPPMGRKEPHPTMPFAAPPPTSSSVIPADRGDLGGPDARALATDGRGGGRSA
jgi:DivIVA protein